MPKLFKVKFALPKKFETILLVLMGLSLTYIDYLKNRIESGGLQTTTSFLGITPSFSALSAFWYFIIAYHIFLITMVSMALLKDNRTSTSHLVDGIVGGIVTFGTILLIVGVLFGVYTTNIPFLSFNTTVLKLYYIGLIIQLLGTAYFAITD